MVIGHLNYERLCRNIGSVPGRDVADRLLRGLAGPDHPPDRPAF